MATATNEVVEAIFENVRYRNDSSDGPATERTFTASMQDTDSSTGTGIASIIPLLVKLTGLSGSTWTGSESLEVRRRQLVTAGGADCTG